MNRARSSACTRLEPPTRTDRNSALPRRRRHARFQHRSPRHLAGRAAAGRWHHVHHAGGCAGCRHRPAHGPVPALLSQADRSAHLPRSQDLRGVRPCESREDDPGPRLSDQTRGIAGCSPTPSSPVAAVPRRWLRAAGGPGSSAIPVAPRPRRSESASSATPRSSPGGRAGASPEMSGCSSRRSMLPGSWDHRRPGRLWVAVHRRGASGGLTATALAGPAVGAFGLAPVACGSQARPSPTRAGRSDGSLPEPSMAAS